MFSIGRSVLTTIAREIARHPVRQMTNRACPQREPGAWHGYCCELTRRKHRTDATGASSFMAVQPVQALPASQLAYARSASRVWLSSSHAAVAALLLPSLAFLATFFAFPAVGLLACSFLSQAPDGTIGLPLTLEHYRHFFDTPLYTHVLLTTLRISLVATGIAIALGYPVALVMVRTNPVVNRLLTMIVIAPLIVSVVVRTYGWQLILANGKTGILNWLLLTTGLAKLPVKLLYSETAVVIGSLHVFYPMMVLPLASALGRIDPASRMQRARWVRHRGGSFAGLPCPSVYPDWQWAPLWCFR